MLRQTGGLKRDGQEGGGEVLPTLRTRTKGVAVVDRDGDQRWGGRRERRWIGRKSLTTPEGFACKTGADWQVRSGKRKRFKNGSQPWAGG